MARRTFTSIESTADQAEAYVQQGRWVEAERHYRELIGQTHVINYEYDDWLRRLGEIYRALHRPREAAFVYLYLHYFDMARAQLVGDEHVGLRARLAELEKKWSEAAQLYQQAKLPVHAAVSFERAKQYTEATAAWRALLHHPELGHRPYEAALVHFNYGLAAVRLDAGSAEARRALIESQRKLEQVADDFEQVGELERAFDCFQILLKLGKESAQFENLAEGYVNCIRVLRDDKLKLYVLQYYQDFQRIAHPDVFEVVDHRSDVVATVGKLSLGSVRGALVSAALAGRSERFSSPSPTWNRMNRRTRSPRPRPSRPRRGAAPPSGPGP